MTIKMLLLKTGETLIAETKEVVQEDQLHGFMMSEPQIVEVQEKSLLTEEVGKNSNYEVDISLRPWIILSKDKDFVVTADIIATICNPLDSVLEMYSSKINPTPISETEVV